MFGVLGCIYLSVGSISSSKSLSGSIHKEDQHRQLILQVTSINVQNVKASSLSTIHLGSVQGDESSDKLTLEGPERYHNASFASCSKRTKNSTFPSSESSFSSNYNQNQNSDEKVFWPRNILLNFRSEMYIN